MLAKPTPGPWHASGPSLPKWHRLANLCGATVLFNIPGKALADMFDESDWYETMHGTGGEADR